MVPAPLARSKTQIVEKGVVNQLEDLALTQTLFEEGQLIHHGDMEEFVDIIRKNRNSLNNLDVSSARVRELI